MKKLRQTLVPTPVPPLTCPGLRYWQPHIGTPYLVFVDESFRGFFEFEERGYFVHATVGIPESQYDALKERVAPVFRDYRGLTSAGEREIKHTEFKRIEYRDRRRLAMRLRDVFTAHGVFINVFYTPLRSFVLEHVRTRLFFDEQREIPADFKTLYDEAARDLSEEAQGPGQSGLIKKLLLLPISGVANMLATFDSQFTVIYDPRERKEDKAVIAAIDEVLATLMNFKGKDVEMRWDLHSFVKGFVHDRRSEEEVGLQMADLLAGETRAFFAANPELMEFAASRKLITQASYEPLVTVARAEGHLFKTGALNRLPAALRRKWIVQDKGGRTVLPLFRELFGAGVATCYSSWGQPRHIAIFDGYVFDQLE
jgi:hypothetical protein